MSLTPTHRRTAVIVLVSGLLLGCQVERDHETEACIDRLMEQEGYEAAEAQAECMGGDDASTSDGSQLLTSVFSGSA